MSQPVQRKRKHPGRKKTAFHEAGHAVAYLLIGADLTFLTINEDREALGRTRAIERRPVPDLDLLALEIEEELVALLAGTAAGRRATGNHWALAVDAGLGQGRDDWKKAYSLVDEYQEVLGYVDHLYIDATIYPVTRRIVRAEWKAITALALALMEKGSLTGEEISYLAFPRLTGLGEKALSTLPAAKRIGFSYDPAEIIQKNRSASQDA